MNSRSSLVGAGASDDAGLVFNHRGRNYRLFRRPGQINFYLRASVDGKRALKCLGSPDVKVAIKNAKIWLDAVANQDWGKMDELRAKSPWCSLGEMLHLYEEVAGRMLGIRASTVTQNSRALEQIVREGLNCSVGAVASRRADVLSADLIRAYVRVARAAGRTDHAIASRLNCARSVVCRAAVDNIYRGLKLPDFSEFRAFDAALSGPVDLGFRPFSAAQEVALERAAAVARVEDPGLWLCYIAMARFGLRNKEVRMMRWGWFVEQVDGRVVLEIRNRPEEDYRTKTGEARAILVPVELWGELSGLRGDRVFYLPGGSMTERQILAERRINRMVRPILPGYRKGAYELRRWAGSRIWTEVGPAAAQRFLGHASISTTERYYSRYLRPVSAVEAPVLAVAGNGARAA